MENYEGSNVLPKGPKDSHNLYYLTLIHPYRSTPHHSTNPFFSILIHPYHSIPHHTTASCISLPVGIHLMDITEGPLVFMSCLTSLHPLAAWLQHCTYHPLVPAGFNAHLPRVK